MDAMGWEGDADERGQVARSRSCTSCLRTRTFLMFPSMFCFMTRILMSMMSAQRRHDESPLDVDETGL